MLPLLLTLCLTAGVVADPAGGAVLKDEATGVGIWHRESGSPNGPVVLFLHGGPGRSSYIFEKAVGRKLERRLRMVYLDQRGSGRSPPLDDPARFSMASLVEDIERLRAALHVDRLGIIAHGFGGVIALEYVKEHPDRVSGLVLVESTTDLKAAFESQLTYLAKVGPTAFKASAPQLRTLAESQSEPPSARLMRAYKLVGAEAAQRQLEWTSTDSQSTVEGWERDLGLSDRPPPAFIQQMQSEGYLDTRREDLMGPLRVQAALFVGRRSHALGAELVRNTCAAWRIPALWFERSGHFPFIDESDLFASRAIAILTR